MTQMKANFMKISITLCILMIFNLSFRERNIAVNYTLYVKFWEIQKYFSNPNTLSDSEIFHKFENVSFFYN